MLSNIAYELPELVDKSYRVTVHDANILGHVINSYLINVSLNYLPPLSTSDHFLIYVKIDAKPKATSDMPFHRTIYLYTKAERDNFRS